TDVVTHYGPIRVLKAVTLEVRAGEIVCLLGGNASGKSTTMKTILGVVRPTAGRVEFEDRRIDRLPTEAIVRRGVSLVPESRRIFARMTVWENLAMGAFTRQKAPAGELAEDFERVYTLFPRLSERQHQLGGTLSGGEQQMLAVGLALGTVYGLIALGYTMVYGVLLMINFAHGEIFMIGAYVGWGVLTALLNAQVGGLHPAWVVPLLLLHAMLVAGLLGVCLERFAYRPLYLRGATRLGPLISAVGASIFLQNA